MERSGGEEEKKRRERGIYIYVCVCGVCLARAQVLHPWSEISCEEKKESPSFTVGGADWNILLFPQGNGTNHKDSMSAFLNLSKEDIPDKWYKHAQLRLIVVDQKVKKEVKEVEVREEEREKNS